MYVAHAGRQMDGARGVGEGGALPLGATNKRDPKRDASELAQPATASPRAALTHVDLLNRSSPGDQIDHRDHDGDQPCHRSWTDSLAPGPSRNAERITIALRSRKSTCGTQPRRPETCDRKPWKAAAPGGTAGGARAQRRKRSIQAEHETGGAIREHDQCGGQVDRATARKAT